MWPFKKPTIAVDAQVIPTRPAWAGDSLQNFMTGMGTMSDKTSYSRYMPEVGIDRMTADSLFRSSWLGKRIVTTVADDMVRKWRTVMWDGSQDEDGVFDITREEDRLQVRKRVHSCIKWSRHYGGSLMIMVVKNQSRREQLEEPIDVEKVKKGDLQNLIVYDRWRVYGTPPDKRDYQAEAATFVPYLNQQFGDPNFGFPEFYYLADTSAKIHHSRCIRFNGEELPWTEWTKNAMWDDSIYKTGLRAITSYDELMSACRNLVTKASIDIFSASDLADTLSTNDGTKRAQIRYQALAMMMSVYGIAIIDKDKESFDRKPLTFAGLKDLCDRFALDISGAYDIPLVRLFGMAPGGLNSDGESNLINYENHVAAKQVSDISPQLAQLDQVVVRSALDYMPDDYRSAWNPLRQMTEAQLSQIGYQDAQRDALYLDRSVITREAAATELRASGKMPNLTQDVVDAAKKQDADAGKAAEVAAKKAAEPTPPTVIAPEAKTTGEESNLLPIKGKAKERAAV